MAIRERSCVILCNFNEKEQKLIKSFGSMMGLRDQINVSWKNGDSIVGDIVDGNITNTCENGVKDRAIIFNAIEPLKVSMFIDNMRKMRIAPAMKAIVTETSNEWNLNNLLENLVEERKAEKTGKQVKHQ